MLDPIAFGLASAALLFSPGPTNAMLATAGLMDGARAWRLVGAEVLGYACDIALLSLVLVPLLRAFPALDAVFKTAVALYLIFLAVRLWRRPAARSQTPGAIGFADVFFVTLFNPKAFVLVLGVIPFASPALPAYLAGLALIIALGGTTWVVLGALVGRFADGGSRWASRTAALVLIGFAGVLAAGAFAA